MQPCTRRQPTFSLRSRRGLLGAIVVSAALAAVTTLVPSDARGSISWTGNYETGDFSQWVYGVQQEAAGRATIVSSPSRQGHYAARYEVDPGDNNVAGSGSGERTEALLDQVTTDGYSGREQWWAWSTYWDPTFQSTTSGWNYFTQFHHTGTTGQASVAWASPGNTILMRVCDGDTSAPTCRYWTLDSNRQNGRWYDFVFHVKWSSDSTVGFIEMWENGNKIVPLTQLATLYAGQAVYLKQGYYREAQSTTAVLYHDGMRRGSSYQDVIADFPVGTWPANPDGSSSTTALPPPTISGSPVVGSSLVVNVDTSSLPGDPISIDYQWRPPRRPFRLL